MFLEYIPVPVEIMNPPAGVPWWEIVTAIGALLAVLVPAVLFFVEWHGRKKAEAELRDQRANQEAATKEVHARKVAAWVEQRGEMKAGDTPTKFTIKPRVLLAVKNFGETPVFYVRFKRTDIHPDDDRHIDLYGQDESLGPGESSQFELFELSIEPSNFFVQFRDIEGNQWRRYGDGTLKPDNYL